VVVHPSVPAKNLAELVAHTKAKPGLAYSSFGPASIAHFGMELVMLRTGMRLTHVPYKGGGPSAAALAAGEVQVSFDSVQNQLQFVRSNRVRALAVASGARLKVLPHLPTLTEVGVSGADIGGWYALLAPAGTPKAIVNRLHGEAVNAFKSSDELRARFESTGSEIVLQPPGEFAERIKREIVEFTKVARDANITVNQ
jgi:tripartite-type tricarboxylate transporter receptor subunit TctC